MTAEEATIRLATELIERYTKGDRVFSGTKVFGANLSKNKRSEIPIADTALYEVNFFTLDSSKTILYKVCLAGARLFQANLLGAYTFKADISDSLAEQLYNCI